MIPHPELMIKDWNTYRPDNRIWARQHWFRAHGCLKAILFWCAFCGLVIWHSCR